jgi:hypothetical protein
MASNKETGTLLVSKEVLHKIRDLATELRSLDPTVQIIPTLNEAQKLVLEIEKLEKNLSTAGFFKKRGIKKNLTQGREKYTKLTEDLLNTLLVGYRKFYFDLANHIKEIAKFLPQETETIRKLQIPSFNPTEIIKFSTNVLTAYNQISEVLRGKTLSLLLFNKEIIDLYSKFVNFDEEKIQNSSKTIKTSIHVMMISDLLEIYDLLESENAYLKQRRKGTEGKIQVAIVQMASELQQHLDTVNSIGLNLDDKTSNIKDHIQKIQLEAESETSVENLIEMEKGLNAYGKEFINVLRTYEISLKTETEDQVGRIMQIIGKGESETSLSPAPEIDISATNIPKYIQDIEKIRSWHQQQIIEVKKIVSTAELKNAAKSINAMKIPVPTDFNKGLREVEKESQKIKDLSDWVIIVKRYYNLKSQLAESCQNYFFRMLENPHIQEAINIQDGPQIPIVRDFEILNPSELITKAREIKDWETRLIAYFSKPSQRSLRQNLLNLFDSRESLRNILSDELKTEIELQRESNEVEEKDIKDLVHEIEGLTRLNASIKSELWNVIDVEIHPILNLLTSLETIPPKLKAQVPVLVLDDLKSVREDIIASSKASTQELLEQYEQIPVWKYKISSRIRENLKTIPFPLIPIETRFDLRERRNQIVHEIDNHSESGNIEAVVKEYVSFLETIEENKNEILIELKKQIESLNGVDKRLYRLFKATKSSVAYPSDKELEDLDYSEALTEYWQLKSHTERKIAALAEQMEREIYSHKQDYSKLPNQYAMFFEKPLQLMEEKMNEIKTHKDIVRLVNVFESYSLESLQMAKDSVATLHRNLYNWLRVSLPRINEIAPVDPVVFSAESKIADFDTEESSHERLAHKFRQLIFLYDTEILAVLFAQAVQESRKVLKNVNDLKEVGINIISYVGGYIETFSQVIVKSQEDVQLREITDVFVEIDRLQSDPKALKEIRSMGEQYISEIQDTVEYLFNHYQIDLRQDERIDFTFLGKFQEIAIANHIGNLTEAILELGQVRNTVIESVKSIEKKRNAYLQVELGNLEYYSNIQELFKKYIDEASKRIFPLSGLIGLRDEFLSSHDLKYILDLLPQIDKQREEWKEVSVQLNRWHRAIRMFRPRYTPTDSSDENKRQFKEISKKIKETYPRNKVIREYLSLVMRMFIEFKSGIEID